MLKTKLLPSFLGLIAGVGGILTPSIAEAVNFITLPANYSDTDFNNAKSNAQSPFFNRAWQEDWVAEARGGNNATNGDAELFINNWTDNTTSPGGQNVTSAQNVFISGQAIDFSVSYNGTTGTFIWGTNLSSPITLTRSNLTEAARFPDGLDSIFIRLRSNATSSFRISNLVVNGSAYTGPDILADSNDTIDYFLITGITDNFTLTGRATLSWTGATAPRGSNLGMTIKMGYGEAVPEPLTLLGAGAAVGFGIFFKKKIGRAEI